MRAFVKRDIIEILHYSVRLNSIPHIFSHVHVQVSRTEGSLHAHPNLLKLPDKNLQHNIYDISTLLLLVF